MRSLKHAILQKITMYIIYMTIIYMTSTVLYVGTVKAVTYVYIKKYTVNVTHVFTSISLISRCAFVNFCLNDPSIEVAERGERPWFRGGFEESPRSNGRSEKTADPKEETRAACLKDHQEFRSLNPRFFEFAPFFRHGFYWHFRRH